jgi:NADPH:quinone reductase-like Zn-dependent oxidoreductase
LKIGDAVASLVSGASNLDPDTGSFAEYVRAEADRTYIFPKGLVTSKENSIPVGEVKTFEGASSIGVSYTTV